VTTADTLDLEALREAFMARGIGARVGFGTKPALLVVDATRAFTDPSSPLGTDAEPAVEAICVLVEEARAASIPIVFTAPVYAGQTIWSKKIPAQRELAPGSDLVKLHPRLDRLPGEKLVEKHHPSVFFDTDVADYLRERDVDTVIVTGLTTSGCVRATVVDSCSLGFRTIVAEEAVADRAELPHLASLFDMDRKYADVTSCDEIGAHLRRSRGA
jgi:nicotinamidase-related amidase